MLLSAIATSMTILAIAPPIFANPVPISWKISQQDTNNLPQTATLIYVAPRANASGDGSLNNPYGSITAALATKPVAGSVIQLQQGVYSAETGESFPLRLPAGVTLRGEPTVRGLNTIIKGGGKFISPSFASQNITILTNDDVRLEGMTLTNPNTRGTAVWVESAKRVTIANNTLTNSDREGVFLTGTAEAIVSENVFKKNGANGLSAVGSSRGEIKNNTFESTGFGLAIGQKSRVNISNNNILNNTDGVIISNLSAPTLRNNLIADNQRNGIVILKDRKGYPTPDLGTSRDLGKNIFRNNLDKDLNNNSGVTQVAVGNELNPKKIAGDFAFVGESATAPAPQIATLPVPAITPNLRSQPSFNLPVTTPTVLPPSRNSVLIEPLPDVPPQRVTPSITAQNPTDILIDRDPIPALPPQIATPSLFIPNNPPAQTIPATPIPSQAAPISISPSPIPYNAKVAALVPPPARETFPYLVVIPASDNISLDRVQSVVPTAKIIPSRFGNIIMVQGYPDRDRAEVLKTIMRSEIGLDARVIYQNNL
jgi:parallel beta-helix repeat protein